MLAVQFSSVTQLCLTPCDPMDCSLPGSSVHGIFQARVPEWGAIAFSIMICQLAYKKKQANKKKQAPLWFSHWNEAGIEDRYTHRKTKIGKITSISSLRKKKSLHTRCSFSTELFSHALIGVFCFVLFCFECWVALPCLLYTYTYIHTRVQEPPDGFLVISKR